MMLFLTVALGAALDAGRASTAVESSPVARVVDLLKNLRDQVQTEGSDEASNYNTFACFCKDKDTAKVTSIDTRTSNKASLEANLESLNANQKQLTADLAALNAQLDADEASLARATELRNKEREAYEADHLDTSNAVSGVEDALASITGSKSLLEMKATVHNQIALAKAGGIPTVKAVSLLQSMKAGPGGDTYDFHSGGIIDLLNGFKKDWNEKKTSMEQAEQANADAFNKAADAKRDEISTAKSTIATKTTQLEECEEDIADDTKSLTEETALLNDDKTYLKDLTEQCERKAREWDQRSAQRRDELAALNKALEIIEGTVVDAETNSGAGGRPTLLTQGVPAKKVAVIQSSEEDDDDDTYSDVVFVQRSVEVQKHRTTELRGKAITILKKEGLKLNSQVLELAAMQMAADPFAKIKTLIQGLIERLLSEATDEASQKGWCDTEIGKAETDRSYRDGDVQRLSADIGVYEANKAAQEEQMAELKQSISDLNTALTEATTNRENDKAANKATLEAATAGLEALKNAITVLNDFYRKAGRATTSLVQASPVDQDMAAGGTGGFSGAYKGNQAQAGGILGMLATIQSDFERTISTTTDAEKQAQADYVKFKRESDASIRSQETGLKHTENDHALTSSKLVSALNELVDQQSLLDTALRTLETLRPACVDTGMTWEEKVAKRDAEIQALKDARCVLDEEDNEYPECNNFLFLQKK
jgi:chromosome segregation ATPase